MALLAWVFFLSGVLALVYEVLWQRHFALVFGSAAPATAAVLAAYFAGLALGSWLIGRIKTSARPLRLYAALEGGIAVGVVWVEGWLRLYDWIRPSLGGLGLGPLMVAKTILAFIALALPTICMGGTLPALGAFVDGGRKQLGRTAGLLYVVNTAGAALGVLVMPFVLLPWFGARAALAICATGNLALAAIAWRMDRVLPLSQVLPPPEVRSKTSEGLARRGMSKTMCAAFFSGFVAFVAQVLWNRAFAQVHENSLYSFALIAAIFILALAIGGQSARLALARRIPPERILAFAWIGAGLLMALSPWLFLRMTNGLTYLARANGWWHYGVNLAGLGLVVVFPAAALMGLGLPAIMERAGAATPANSGKALGRLLSVNLIGAVTGSLAAGFLLPPWLGMWGGMMLMACFLVGFGMFTLSTPIRVGGFLVFLVTPWLLRIDLPRVRVADDRGEKLLAMAEGTHGIAAVVERGNSRRLKLNNSYVLGGTVSTGDERMQSHLPLLLHPRPQRVVYLGLGTGITAGGAAFHSLEQVTLLELVPEVAGAARKYFADANNHILEDPKTRLIVEDARNYLRHTQEKFDVIIGDLVVPWRSGEAALFTRQNFQAAREALAPGGVFCQWLPMFQLAEDEFQILLKTFLTVFPEAYIWRGDFSPTEPSLAFVGFENAGALSAEIIRKRIREMQPDPMNPQLSDDFAVWMGFLGVVQSNEVDARWLVNSEDRPWIELLGPLKHAGKNAEALFMGQRLQRWSSELKGRDSLGRFKAGERELSAMNAGQALMNYTIAVSEGDPATAQRVQREMQTMVPPDLYRVLFPSEVRQ